MSNKSVFSPLLLLGFVIVAIGTAILGLYLAKGQQDAIDNLGAGTFSHSAIGHAGLSDLLDRLKIPVIKSKSNSLSKAKDGLLVIAEPSPVHGGPQNPLYSLIEAEKILLVLPKWTGTKSRKHPGWLGHVTSKWAYEAEMVLKFAVSKGDVVRVDKVDNWDTNTFNLTPRLDKPVQLVTSKYLTPLIGTKEGMLLGELETDDRKIWVLSDPDVISNHGLGKDGKGNAVLAVEMIKRLRGADSGSVVFDETIHGFEMRTKSPWDMLFQFPFSIVALQAAAALALLMWSTMGRFGPSEKAPVSLSAGKQGLIDNMARLMEFAGHQKLMVHRYVEATIRDTARQLHAPKGLSGRELAVWMQRIGTARGVKDDNIAILDRANGLLKQTHSDLQVFVTIAKSIYRWKQEIIDGRSKHTPGG